MPSRCVDALGDAYTTCSPSLLPMLSVRPSAAKPGWRTGVSWRECLSSQLTLRHQGPGMQGLCPAPILPWSAAHTSTRQVCSLSRCRAHATWSLNLRGWLSFAYRRVPVFQNCHHSDSPRCPVSLSLALGTLGQGTWLHCNFIPGFSLHGAQDTDRRVPGLQLNRELTRAEC